MVECGQLQSLLAARDAEIQAVKAELTALAETRRSTRAIEMDKRIHDLEVQLASARAELDTSQEEWPHDPKDALLPHEPASEHRANRCYYDSSNNRVVFKEAVCRHCGSIYNVEGE